MDERFSKRITVIPSKESIRREFHRDLKTFSDNLRFDSMDKIRNKLDNFNTSISYNLNFCKSFSILYHRPQISRISIFTKLE